MKTASKAPKSVAEKINMVLLRGHCLLSAFYQSKSTNYASCLDSPPFVKITDKAEIVKLGYSKAAKAVVALDLTHEWVKAEIAAKQAENEQRQRIEQAKQARIADLSPKLMARVSECLPELQTFLECKHFTDRKLYNEQLYKAVATVGMDYAKALGWNRVFAAIQEAMNCPAA